MALIKRNYNRTGIKVSPAEDSRTYHRLYYRRIRRDKLLEERREKRRRRKQGGPPK